MEKFSKVKIDNIDNDIDDLNYGSLASYFSMENFQNFLEIPLSKEFIKDAKIFCEDKELQEKFDYDFPVLVNNNILILYKDNEPIFYTYIPNLSSKYKQKYFSDLHTNHKVVVKKIKEEKIKELYDLRIFIFAEKELGIKLRLHSIETQVQFLNFFKKSRENYFSNDYFKLKKFLKYQNKDYLNVNKNLRFKTFLSLDELGEQFGDKILELGELENADEIFEIYSNLIDRAENIREELQSIFKDKKIELKDEQINNIVKNILRKGANILLEFSESVEKKDIYKIQSLLKKYEAEIEFRGNVYKTMRQSGVDIDFNELEGVDFISQTSVEFSKEINKNEIKNKLSNYLKQIINDIDLKKNPFLNPDNFIKEHFKEELSQEEKDKIEEVIEMLSICYNSFSKKHSSIEIKELLNTLIDKILFGGNNSEIFQYKLKNKEGKYKIIVFFTFTKKEERVKFANHYSARSDGYGIAKSLVDTVFKRETDDIYADAFIEMCEEYLKPSYDFVINKINKNQQKGRENTVDIKVQKNKKWKFRKTTEEEIIKQIEISLGGEGFKILEFKEQTTKEAMENNLDLLESEINKNSYCITRSIKYNNFIYLILEKDIERQEVKTEIFSEAA